MLRRLIVALSMSLLWTSAAFAQSRYRPVGAPPPAKADAHAPAKESKAHAIAPVAPPVVVPVVAPVTVVAKAPEPEESIEEIVARVKRRLAQQQPRRPAAAHAPVEAPPPAHLSLVWRTSVLWPEDLLGMPDAPATPVIAPLVHAPPSPAQDRISVAWDSIKP